MIECKMNIATLFNRSSMARNLLKSVLTLQVCFFKAMVGVMHIHCALKGLCMIVVAREDVSQYRTYAYMC